MAWIDLTQTIHSSMPGVSIEMAKTLEKDGWNARTLNLYSHSGTHADAPVHFGMPGPTIDEMEMDRLTGEAWLLDLTGIEERALIQVDDLGGIIHEFHPGDSLLIKTGWSKLAANNPSKYRDGLPRISKELATWMVEKQLKILLVEPPSVADVNNLPEVTEIHRILFGGQVFIVEGICNVDALQSKKVEVIVLPLKIKQGDGAPARVIAKNL